MFELPSKYEYNLNGNRYNIKINFAEHKIRYFTILVENGVRDGKWNSDRKCVLRPINLLSHYNTIIVSVMIYRFFFFFFKFKTKFQRCLHTSLY